MFVLSLVKLTCSVDGGNAQKLYILRDALPQSIRKALPDDGRLGEEKALILATLMFVSLSGDQIEEGTNTHITELFLN